METESSSQKIATTFDLNNLKICAHCHTTKTSLWRNRPLGPKSMCNACGIRYKRRGMKKVQLEIKDDKGKKQRRSGMKEVQNQKRSVKTVTLGSKARNNKNKGFKKVELGVMMTSVDCQKESGWPQSQQYDDEVVKLPSNLWTYLVPPGP